MKLLGWGLAPCLVMLLGASAPAPSDQVRRPATSVQVKVTPPTDYCATYGYSGHPMHALSCANIGTGRQITCAAGYYASPPSHSSIDLHGSDPFQGCVQLPTKPTPVTDFCATYGYSGHPMHALSCANIGTGRQITCAARYYASPPSHSSIDLHGSDPFQGCVQIDMCMLYGYSGHQQWALSCTSGLGVRTIVCAQGYVAIQGMQPSTTLTGPVAFAGCTGAPRSH